FPRLPESRLDPRLQTACKSSLIFRPVRDRPPLHPHTPPQARFKEMSIAGSPPASSLAEVSFARNRRPPDCPHPYIGATRSRNRALLGHLPLNLASRFSRKAEMPSCLSSVL